LKVIVAGLGVQGHKRQEYAGADFVASVDPVNPEADFQDLREVSLDSYDSVLACVPDEPKIDLLHYCLSHQKHVLVEKPLWAAQAEQIKELESLARTNEVVCYTAYNHRFEPHFLQMRDLIASGELGEIYSCRMFYGNGTARLVRDSVWRDQGAGVLPDLGSHLLDTCRYWFGENIGAFQLISANCFENRAPDHVVIGNIKHSPRIELEMTLCMWRNHFTCDILAENGTAHIESLCKWGPSTFTHRKRMFPSGRPPETQVTLVQSDPTWAREYENFKNLIASDMQTDLSTDTWLLNQINSLSKNI
jgi:scyllo-inositol 2-dehydrogenase (NADP+)